MLIRNRFFVVLGFFLATVLNFTVSWWIGMMHQPSARQFQSIHKSLSVQIAEESFLLIGWGVCFVWRWSPYRFLSFFLFLIDRYLSHFDLSFDFGDLKLMPCNAFPSYASSALGFSFHASSLVHTNLLFPSLYFLFTSFSVMVFRWCKRWE